MTGRARSVARGAALAALAGLLAVAGACGQSGGGPPTGVLPDAGGAGGEDAGPRAARELPPLEPSGLESIEVLTGGAAAVDTLPLVIALHGYGGTPESFSKVVEGFDRPARIVVPRGPLKAEEGRAWFAHTGPESAVIRMMARSADKVAALADEISASRPTKGRAIVVGYSQGGMIAFLVAARQPARVGAVVPVASWLPQHAWPDEERLAQDRPVIRALSGADDELTKAADLRRCIVKLRMLKLDATARLYSGTGHVLSPAMGADLFRTLRWLVAGTEEPPACEPCPGQSMDPDACSLCPAGAPGDLSSPEATASAAGAGAGRPAASAAKAAGGDGPDLTLGREGIKSALSTGAGGAGGLSREQIQKTFRRNMAPIRFCHEQRLASQPGLSGRVSIRLVVAADGTVSSADVATSTMGNAAVEECVRRAVTRVRFPRAEGGGSTTVTYPFLFAASSP